MDHGAGKTRPVELLHGARLVFRVPGDEMRQHVTELLYLLVLPPVARALDVIEDDTAYLDHPVGAMEFGVTPESEQHLFPMMCSELGGCCVGDGGCATYERCVRDGGC